MHRTIIISLAIVLTSFSIGLAQEEAAASAAEAADTKISLKSPLECKLLCDSFMQLLSKEKYEEAFDIVKPYWPLPESEMSMLQMQTVTQLNTIAPRFGKITGYKFISEENVDDFVLKFVYAQKHQKHIVIWTLVFYKPEDTWIVNAVLFNDNIYQLFK